MLWTIYHITNISSGKVYVGQTTKPIAQRWKEHCYLALSKSRQKKKLQKAIQAYGANQFKVDAVDTAQTLDEANEKERQWILKLNSIEHGYNLTGGGDGGFFIGRKHSQQSKDKIGAWSRGKSKSVEHRLKISVSNRGKKHKGDKQHLCGDASTGGKYYKIISPEGEVFTIKSLRYFCNNRGLNSATLYSATRRNGVTCSGWVVERV